MVFSVVSHWPLRCADFAGASRQRATKRNGNDFPLSARRRVEAAKLPGFLTKIPAGLGIRPGQACSPGLGAGTGEESMVNRPRGRDERILPLCLRRLLSHSPLAWRASPGNGQGFRRRVSRSTPRGGRWIAGLAADPGKEVLSCRLSPRWTWRLCVSAGPGPTGPGKERPGRRRRCKRFPCWTSLRIPLACLE